MDCPQLSPKGIQTPGTGPWTQSVNFLLWPQTNPTAKLLSPALSAGMDAEIDLMEELHMQWCPLGVGPCTVSLQYC